MRFSSLLLSLLLTASASWAGDQSPEPRRISVIVTKLLGSTETGDALIFKTNRGRFYVYQANDIGEGHVALIKASLKSKKQICLVLDPKLKGFVTEVLPSCNK
jgi:hypothetical protein